MIIDNNILFSLMKPDSKNSSLFSILEIEFMAPSFIIQEFNKYHKDCLKKSGLSEELFEKRKKEILNNIRLFEFKEFRSFLNRAMKNTPDQDDAPYFALALKLNLPIWSNDSDLKKQDKVKIFDTKEIIDLFL